MSDLDYISKYLQADAIWQNFGIKSQADYIQNYITKGKFHVNVPEVIQNDYKIVERLQFFSYYGYPLIDEAFGKATRIFEASIDFKINALGIEKKGFEPLSSKIRRLETYSSNELHKQWVNSKELRNLFAHHKAGRLMGITLIKAFKHIVNMINSVFLEKNEITEKENVLKKIAKESAHLKKGLFIMEYSGNKYLVWSMQPYTASLKDGLEQSFWVFHPVYGVNKIERVSDFPEPFKLNLKNLKITNDGLSATVIETEETVKITKTYNIDNIAKYEFHLKQMLDLNLDLKDNYMLFLHRDINKAITDFIYLYAWQ